MGLTNRIPPPLRKKLGAARRTLLMTLAAFWRRLMFRTTVVAITGSVGKTTAKECLASILSRHGRTLKTPNNQNDHYGVPSTLFKLRPWHRYAIIEIGAAAPGHIEELAKLARPHIAVILSVAHTHTDKFATLEETAREKATLLDFLPKDGTAILNGDDPLVRPMRSSAPGPVVYFGENGNADVAARSITSRWPDRMSFMLEADRQEHPVRTQLVGKHWVSSCLAAVSAARACGIPLANAAEAIATTEPFLGRMQPVSLPCGAIVIRDESNGTPEAWAALVDVLRSARAKRRVLVFSDISGDKDKPRRRLARIGRLAAEVSDLAVFVGERAHYAVRGAEGAGMNGGSCRGFASLRQAAEYLGETLEEGDLVFLKGRVSDHLSRLFLAQFGEIGCWKASCRKQILCDSCPELNPEFTIDGRD